MKKSIFYRFLASVIPFVLFMGVIGETHAAPAEVFTPSNVVFREAMSGLTQPIFIANAGDSSNRLFVVERAGIIRIFKDGSLLTTPFLDIQSIVNDTGSEQGLLALAFHPSYETNGRFFTVHTDQNGSLVLSRFTRFANNPDLANPSSRVPI